MKHFRLAEPHGDEGNDDEATTTITFVVLVTRVTMMDETQAATETDQGELYQR